MEAYLGYVMFTAGSFAPRGWSLCQGQLLGISQNTALYSLLGVTYGGNGSSNFGLPNLGGRTPVGTGQSPGVSHNYTPGEMGGIEQTTLTSSQMPAHVHAVPAQPGMTAITDNIDSNTSATPTDGAHLGVVQDQSGSGLPPLIYVPAGQGSTSVNLAGGAAGTTGPAGASQPVPILQPYLAMNAVICVEGLFPSRP